MNSVRENPSEEKPALPLRNHSSHATSDHINCPKPTIYFKDGLRSVDFVLVWDSLEKEAITDESYQRRKIFEANLVKEGLELEYEPPEKNGLNFIKVRMYNVYLIF